MYLFPPVYAARSDWKYLNQLYAKDALKSEKK